MISLFPDEHIENISPELRLIVSVPHTFGTDALLLASFAMPKKKEKVCDFGTGCGIIPFYWLREGVEKVCAVELQPRACGQLRRSVEMNALEDRLFLTEGDIRELKGTLPAGSFDLITMNPPYTAAGHGIDSASAADRIARHETDLTLSDLFQTASLLLKFGGRICVCLRPERLAECMNEMKKYRIEPKRLRFVSQRDGKAPWLFLLEGKLGRNPGLTVEPELHMEAPDGTQSEEMKRIIGSYADRP